MTTANSTTLRSSSNLDWLLEVGVSKLEVMWLKSMIGSPKLDHPVAARRLKAINEIAYKGIESNATHVKLFATIQ